MDDKVKAAIEASADKQTDGVVMKQIPVRIASTGRPAVIAIPADATEYEIAELCGWMLSAVLPAFAAERKAERDKTAGGRIIVAGAVPTVLRNGH